MIGSNQIVNKVLDSYVDEPATEDDSRSDSDLTPVTPQSICAIAAIALEHVVLAEERCVVVLRQYNYSKPMGLYSLVGDR